MKSKYIAVVLTFLLLFTPTFSTFASAATPDTQVVKAPTSTVDNIEVHPNGLIFDVLVKAARLAKLLGKIIAEITTKIVSVALNFIAQSETGGAMGEKCEEVRTQSKTYNPYDHNNWVGPGYTTSGIVVRVVQQDLADIGINPGPVDGYYGPRTKAAIQEFQRDHGLTPDGIVGYNTWRKFVDAVC